MKPASTAGGGGRERRPGLLLPGHRCLRAGSPNLRAPSLPPGRAAASGPHHRRGPREGGTAEPPGWGSGSEPGASTWRPREPVTPGGRVECRSSMGCPPSPHRARRAPACPAPPRVPACRAARHWGKGRGAEGAVLARWERCAPVLFCAPHRP